MKPSDIIIANQWGDAILEHGTLMGGRMRQYAEVHGYGYRNLPDVDVGRAAVFYKKYAAVLKCFEENPQWVLWLDADCVIEDMTVRLERFIEDIDEGFDLLASNNLWGISMGAFLIRNTEWSRHFCEFILKHGHLYPDTPHDEMLIRETLRNRQWELSKIRLAGDLFCSHAIQCRKKFLTHLGGWPNVRRIEYFKEVIMNQPVSYAQYGEDFFIAEFFNGFTGNFLEIGAMDGVKLSNCRKLAGRGWTGVAVEPNPALFIELMRNYSGWPVECILGVMMPESGLRTLHFNQDGLGTTDPETLRTLSDCGVKFTGFARMPAITPKDIVNLYGNHFDFVSIDAEGVDLEIVLASEELLRHTKLLCVETDMPGKPPDTEYQKKWDAAFDWLGFRKVVHKSAGNTLVSR